VRCPGQGFERTRGLGWEFVGAEQVPWPTHGPSRCSPQADPIRGEPVNQTGFQPLPDHYDRQRSWLARLLLSCDQQT
jgi:hypothetical protein